MSDRINRKIRIEEVVAPSRSRMMLMFFRPWIWALAVLGLLASPGLIAPLFEVDYHDPAHCTLDQRTCDLLRH